MSRDTKETVVIVLFAAAAFLFVMVAIIAPPWVDMLMVAWFAIRVAGGINLDDGEGA